MQSYKTKNLHYHKILKLNKWKTNQTLLMINHFQKKIKQVILVEINFLKIIIINKINTKKKINH